jgi:hypothetical protein
MYFVTRYLDMYAYVYKVYVCMYFCLLYFFIFFKKIYIYVYKVYVCIRV